MSDELAALKVENAQLLAQLARLRERIANPPTVAQRAKDMRAALKRLTPEERASILRESQNPTK